MRIINTGYTVCDWNILVINNSDETADCLANYGRCGRTY